MPKRSTVLTAPEPQNEAQPDFALLQIEHRAAVDKNFKLLQEMGELSRMVMGWVQQTNPALWARLRQRLAVGASLLSALQFHQAQGEMLIQSGQGSTEADALRQTEHMLLRWLRQGDAELYDQIQTASRRVPTQPLIEVLGQVESRGTRLVAGRASHVATIGNGDSTGTNTPSLSPSPSPKQPAATGQRAETTVKLVTVNTATPASSATPHEEQREERTARPATAIRAATTTPQIMREISDWERATLEVIGAGLFLDNHVYDALPASLCQANTEDSRRRQLSDAFKSLELRGWIEVTSLNLKVPNDVLARIEGQKALRFTESGIAAYRTQLSHDPATTKIQRGAQALAVPTQWAKVDGAYSSLESYVLVRSVKAGIQHAATHNEPGAWEVAVFDLMDGTDVALLEQDSDYAEFLHKSARGLQRRFFSGDGAECAPDLVTFMRPRKGGIPTAMLIEVERATYKARDMLDKLRRNIRCYPPAGFSFLYVFPTAQLAGTLFGMSGEAADAEFRMNGWPFGIKALFTDLSRLWRSPWYSPEQVSKAILSAKRKETTVSEKQLPYLFMKERRTRPFEQAQLLEP